MDKSYWLGLRSNEVIRATRDTDAYFLGLWYGDGMRNYAHGKLIGNDLQYIAAHEKDLVGLCDSNIGRWFKFKPRLKNERRKVYIYTYTEEFTSFRVKHFPDLELYKNLFNFSDLSLQDCVEFLAGWFDSDGSVERSNGLHLLVTFKSDRVGLAEYFQPLMIDIGIRTRITRPKRVFDKRTGNWSVVRNLLIEGQESRVQYKNLIGFCQRNKNDIINIREGREKDKSIPSRIGPLIRLELERNKIQLPKGIYPFLRGEACIVPSTFKREFRDVNTELVLKIKQGLRFYE